MGVSSSFDEASESVSVVTFDHSIINIMTIAGNTNPLERIPDMEIWPFDLVPKNCDDSLEKLYLPSSADESPNDWQHTLCSFA